MVKTKAPAARPGVRSVRKTATPRHRSEEFLTRGSSAWDTPKKLNPNSSYFRTIHKRQRIVRLYAKVSFWLAIPLLVAGLSFFILSLDEEPLDLAQSSIPANSSAGKETAFAEITSWLNGEYSPLPGGRIVSWDGYTTQNAPAPESKSDEPIPYRFETHTFTLAQGDAAYKASVQVAVSDTVGAVATSTPTFLPIAKTSQLAGGNPVAWFGFPDATAPDSVQPAVEDWARAFTSGDADALRRAVGDPDAHHVYLPLTGIDEVVEVKISKAAYLPDPNAAEDADILTHNLGMIARVEVSMWWTNQERPEDRSGNGSPAPVTFDVLIEGPETAAPTVKAWGPTGSGPDLVAYQNAVTGVDSSEIAKSDGYLAPTPRPSDTPSMPDPTETPEQKEGDS